MSIMSSSKTSCRLPVDSRYFCPELFPWNRPKRPLPISRIHWYPDSTTEICHTILGQVSKCFPHTWNNRNACRLQRSCSLIMVKMRPFLHLTILDRCQRIYPMLDASWSWLWHLLTRQRHLKPRNALEYSTSNPNLIFNFGLLSTKY